jgi:hypothetical protein
MKRREDFRKPIIVLAFASKSGAGTLIESTVSAAPAGAPSGLCLLRNSEKKIQRPIGRWDAWNVENKVLNWIGRPAVD